MTIIQLSPNTSTNPDYYNVFVLCDGSTRKIIGMNVHNYMGYPAIKQYNGRYKFKLELRK